MIKLLAALGLLFLSDVHFFRGELILWPVANGFLAGAEMLAGIMWYAVA